jgi:hypothetical protein
MRSETQLSPAADDFPVIEGPDVDKVKELYAHIGSTLHAIASLELTLLSAACLQAFHNVFPESSMWRQSESNAEWQRQYQTKKRLTFGGLSKLIQKIPEFQPLNEQLSKALSNRNYIAHHFFREEAAKCTSDEGLTLLTRQMAATCKAMRQLADSSEECFEQLCGRLGVPADSGDLVERQIQSDAENFLRSVAEGKVVFGWQP